MTKSLRKIAFLRHLISALGLVLSLSMLTACGGAGSAGPAAPTGGSNPAAPPASTPPGPVAGGSPSATPTAVPTTTPTTAVPTTTPTAAPTASPTPTPMPTTSTQTLNTYPGATIGTDNLFSPNDGDTPSGGQGQVVDGISCNATMSNNYHVHAYIGVYVNGQQVAMPDAIGMVGAEEPASGFINYANCFYDIHTHDASGIVHFESADPSGVAVTGSLFTTKQLFDIWGITVSALGFGQFSGPVRVYTSGQVYRGDATSSCGMVCVPASTYTLWAGDPADIPIYSHEVIFYEVGPNYPAQLPNVSFYMEY